MPTRNNKADGLNGVENSCKEEGLKDDAERRGTLKNEAEGRGTLVGEAERQVVFGVFDKDAEVHKAQRFLPHWFQPGVATFLTFRTADSMPRKVILLWQRQVRDWLRLQGLAILDDEPLPEATRLPAILRSAYQKNRDRLFQWHLDSCHGACVLRNRELATIVMDSLWHFDGARYDLDSAIVMPNHVHLLVQFHRSTTCRDQCKSWLHYTATKINKALGQKGAFWQSEPFDHLVRNDVQFTYLRKYIAENGQTAKLPQSDYLYVARRSAS